MKGMSFFGLLIIFAVACSTTASPPKVEVVNEEKKPVEKSKNLIEVPSVNYDQFEKDYLSRDDGKVYVINFWATWCGPCVKELPLFENVTATYDSSEVEVILVSIDMAKMKETHLIPFIEKNNLQSQVVHLDDVDMNRWIPLIDEDWSGAIPATIFYQGDRKLFYEGSYEEGELVKQINEFINLKK